MEKEGYYVYCIITANDGRHFGPLGMGDRGDDVFTVAFNDLSMVVSKHPIIKVVVNRENMLLHEKVIEEVMKDFDSVLPVRFSTIASNTDDMRNLLQRKYEEFKNALIKMNHKVELGVKGVWENIDNVFQEIARDNKEIKRLKEKIQNGAGEKNIQAKMELGEMVKQALTKKKEQDAEKIVNILRKTARDYRLNKTINDKLFMNAAFLVDKRQEESFDTTMEHLADKYKDEIKFIYAGPLPVFNFMSITIYPEEWKQ